MNDLECQRTFVEEQRQTMKKIEQEELRAQRKLSMYASVTNIIPNLDNHSKISGRILVAVIAPGCQQSHKCLISRI
ncbi:conserved hypothetical protein [Ricinus communis]|uniref:Uncharacterized protein n=1 Tax=Ricinus communis TaxID=3988 RepID=B9SKZ3_RICCO|nr:conserved hypothetical protein [Ricinus communis]